MSICLYSCLGFPAGKAYLFCASFHHHVWPVWLFIIFSHFLINARTFREISAFKTKRVLIISPTVPEIFLILIIQPEIINVDMSPCNIPAIHVKFLEDIKKYSNSNSSLLVPRSWNSRAIPLPTLWATPGL